MNLEYSTYILIVAILAAPLAFYAIFSDLKFMLIPNWLNLTLAIWGGGCVLIFLGPITFFWNFIFGFGTLVLTYLLFYSGNMGGGDAKYLPGIALIIGPDHAFSFIFVLAVASLVAVAVLRITKRLAKDDWIIMDWVSFKNANIFPFGVPISITFLYHIVLEGYLNTSLWIG